MWHSKSLVSCFVLFNLLHYIFHKDKFKSSMSLSTFIIIHQLGDGGGNILCVVKQAVNASLVMWLKKTHFWWRRPCQSPLYLVWVWIKGLNELGDCLHNDSHANNQDSRPVEPFQFLVLKYFNIFFAGICRNVRRLYSDETFNNTAFMTP